MPDVPLGAITLTGKARASCLQSAKKYVKHCGTGSARWVHARTPAGRYHAGREAAEPGGLGADHVLRLMVTSAMCRMCAVTSPDERHDEECFVCHCSSTGAGPLSSADLSRNPGPGALTHHRLRAGCSRGATARSLNLLHRCGTLGLLVATRGRIELWSLTGPPTNPGRFKRLRRTICAHRPPRLPRPPSRRLAPTPSSRARRLPPPLQQSPSPPRAGTRSADPSPGDLNQ